MFLLQIGKHLNYPKIRMLWFFKKYICVFSPFLPSLCNCKLTNNRIFGNGYTYIIDLYIIYSIRNGGGGLYPFFFDIAAVTAYTVWSKALHLYIPFSFLHLQFGVPSPLTHVLLCTGLFIFSLIIFISNCEQISISHNHTISI